MGRVVDENAKALQSPMTVPMVAVLLVEDEVLIGQLLEENLEEAGFAVTCVHSGAAALARLDADPEGYAAIVTDIRLGGEPDGWDLARAAREHSATIAVVYMSGDSAADWSSHGVPRSVMLGKPFAPAQLITAVSSLLNDEAGRSL